jgi:hypothetical protein
LCRASFSFPFLLGKRRSSLIVRSNWQSFAILKRMLRRMLAVTLLIAFGFPLAAQVLGASPDSDANLPACCRRHGKHHCSAEMGTAVSSGPTFQAPPCPGYPTPASQSDSIAVWLSAPMQIAIQSDRDSALSDLRGRPAQIFAASAHLTRGPPARLT